jgi:hypothetical protein
MELDITNELDDDIFLWSKTLPHKRIEQLEIIFKNEKIPPIDINKLIYNYISLYIQAKNKKSDILYEESNPLILSDFKKKKFINQAIQLFLHKSYFSPIILDKKLYYNQYIVPKYYNNEFIELIDKKDLQYSLFKIPKPYNNIIFQKELFDNIIGTENNILHNIKSNNRQIIRYADLNINYDKSLLELINNRIDKNNIIQNYNYDNYFDTNIISKYNNINIVGFYINTCLNFDNSFINYDITPDLNIIHKINYLYNKNIGKKNNFVLQDIGVGDFRKAKTKQSFVPLKSSSLINIQNKTKFNSSKLSSIISGGKHSIIKKVKTNSNITPKLFELQFPDILNNYSYDIFQEDLVECTDDGISMVYLNNYNKEDLSKKEQRKIWINIINKLLQLLENKELNNKSQYNLYLNNNYFEKLALLNNISTDELIENLNKNVKNSVNNILNYIYRINENLHLHNKSYWCIMIIMIKKIIGLELAASNRKEINNKMKMLKSLEKNPLKLYEKICKDIDKTKNENFLLVCKNGLTTKRKDILEYRYNILLKLINQYNKYVKKNKYLIDIKKFLIKTNVNNQNNMIIRDKYNWYIKKVFGKKELENIIKKSKKLKQNIYDILTSIEKDKINKFIKTLENNRDKILKLRESNNPAIKLRIKYDTSSIDSIKYKALNKLYYEYVDHKPDKNKQLKLKDTNFNIMCEHEKILLDINNTYSKKVIDEKRNILKLEYYSNTEDFDTIYYIMCKYCGRIITRTEIKMYDVYDSDNKKNVGYTKKNINIIDTKIMFQIYLWLSEIINVIIKDKISYSITPELIYSSIGNDVKRYMERYNISYTLKDKVSIDERIDKIIGYLVLGKIIFEIIESQGNIYPTGSRNIIYNIVSDTEDRTKELENYLFEWGIRQMKKTNIGSFLKKIGYHIFSKNDFKNKDKLKSLLKQFYEKIKNKNISIKSNIILTPINYPFNKKLDTEVKNILLIFKNYVNNDENNLINLTRHNYIPYDVYKKITNLYNIKKLNKIYKYYINTKLSEYNKNVYKEQINKLFSELLDINTLSINNLSQNSNLSNEIQNYNYNMFINNDNYNLNNWWKKFYNEIIIMNSIHNILRYNDYLIYKKYYSPNKKRYIKNRLTGKYIDLYNDINNTFNNMKTDFDYEVISYFQNLCIDNTPHEFYKYICINCGQTLSDLENPSESYLKLMKKSYIDIKKEKDIIQLKSLPKLTLPSIDKNNIYYTKYTKYDFNKNILDIVQFLIKNKNLDSNTLKTNQIKTFNKKSNLDYLIEIIKDLGIFKNRRYEEQIKNNINLTKLKNKYKRFRIIQLIKYIKIILQYYSIIKYNKNIDFLKQYYDSEILIIYKQNNINFTYDFNINFDFIDDIYEIKEINFNVKTNILFNILIDIIYKILFNNPSKNNNSTLLSNFIIHILDIFINSQHYNDITENQFNMSDMDYDYKLHIKRKAYLELSKQEKIETGLLSLSYEEQEEFYQDLYYELGMYELDMYESGIQELATIDSMTNQVPNTDEIYQKFDSKGKRKFDYNGFDCEHCDEEAEPPKFDEKNISIN